MAKRPADRFATYDEMQMALEAARTQLLRQRYSHDADPSPPPQKSWWK